MPKAYDLFWSGMILVGVLMMVVLHSTVVYTLWFKQEYDNQPAFQQRVNVWEEFLYILFESTRTFSLKGGGGGTPLNEK